jgi:hypothetical protein
MAIPCNRRDWDLILVDRAPRPAPRAQRAVACGCSLRGWIRCSLPAAVGCSPETRSRGCSPNTQPTPEHRARRSVQTRSRQTCSVARHAPTPRGVDTSVIALWLGHEKTDTVEICLHANLAVKERGLARTAPLETTPGRYRPPTRFSTSVEGLRICRKRECGTLVPQAIRHTRHNPALGIVGQGSDAPVSLAALIVAQRAEHGIPVANIVLAERSSPRHFCGAWILNR